MKKYTKVSTAGNSQKVESNFGVSETVPDQSLTVREIIARFASGILPDISQELEYSEDMPDLRGMDISQLQEMKKEIAAEIKEINEELKSRKSPTPDQIDPSPTPPLPDAKTPETPINTEL